MATTQTPGTGERRGSASPAPGHQQPTWRPGITSFVFETPPGQDEVRARLAALEAAKHATHREADPFCLLCPTVRRSCQTCSGVGTTDDGDRLCPECRGRAA